MAVSEEPTDTSTLLETRQEPEILRVENLHTSFFLPIGELQAVRGVSFSLKRGRSLGIVGDVHKVLPKLIEALEARA